MHVIISILISRELYSHSFFLKKGFGIGTHFLHSTFCFINLVMQDRTSLWPLLAIWKFVQIVSSVLKEYLRKKFSKKLYFRHFVIFRSCLGTVENDVKPNLNQVIMSKSGYGENFLSLTEVCLFSVSPLGLTLSTQIKVGIGFSCYCVLFIFVFLISIYTFSCPWLT